MSFDKYHNDYDYLFKVILIGDNDTGKSSLMNRYAKNYFTDYHQSTIGLDFEIKTLELDNKNIKLHIWDTAGQERFRTITTSYYRGSNAIMIVYDVTNMQSFINVNTWLNEVKQHVSPDAIIMLIGNKIDLTDKIAVSTSDGQEFADNNGLIFAETSSKNASGINKAFTNICDKLIQKNITTTPMTTQKISANNDKKVKAKCC
jgi:Ras-related protein Rab-1A